MDDNSELKSVDVLPKEIIKCKKLRIIESLLGSLKTLPEGLGELKNLE